MSSAVVEERNRSERDELASAMARVVGRRGYAGTSVAEVIAEAKSCRASFERHFTDKEECFAAAHEMLAARALGALRTVIEAESEWPERLIAGLEQALELCDEAPGLARAILVCPAEAGAGGARCRLAMIEALAELVAPEAELAKQLPPRAPLMAVSGVVGLIGEELTAGKSEGLVEQLPELSFALLVPLLGPGTAVEQMRLVATGAQR